MPALIHNMFFQKQRQRNLATTNALSNYEADLTSKERAKAKREVQLFLQDNINDEWAFVWPPRGLGPGQEFEHKFVDELRNNGNREAQRWEERDEWLSNNPNDSDAEPPTMPSQNSPDTASPITAYGHEFENIEAYNRQVREARLKRERRLKEELKFNAGLQCFTARRDAWTGARKTGGKFVIKEQARTKPPPPDAFDRVRTIVYANGDTDGNGKINKGATPHPKPLDTGAGTNGSPNVPVPSQTNGHDHENGYQNDSSSEESGFDTDSDFELPHTEIPIAPPILPATHSIRRSITPSTYGTIFNKVIEQEVTPSCPINLQDILNSCVEGWKSKGEWPPKGSAPEPGIASSVRNSRRKLSVASIFGKNRSQDEERKSEEGDGTGIRKGFQKVFAGLKKDGGAGA